MTNLWSFRCNYYLLHGVSMILTGHKTGAVCDRYNIVNERELLAAGEQLAAM